MLAQLAMLANVSGWGSTTGAACTVDPAVCGTYGTPTPPPDAPPAPVPSGIGWAGDLGKGAGLATVMSFWNALKPYGFKGMALTLPLDSALWKDIKTQCQCTLYYVSANGHGSIPKASNINAVIGPDMADGIVFDQSASTPDPSFCAGMPNDLTTHGFGEDTEILYAIDRYTCERDIRAAMGPGETLEKYHIVFIGDGYSTGNAYSALCPHGPANGRDASGNLDGHYEPVNCPDPDQCSASTFPEPSKSAGCECASIVQANLKFTHTSYVDAEYIMAACPSQTAWYYFEGPDGATAAETTFQIERAVNTFKWTGFVATLGRPPYIWPNTGVPASKYQAGGSSPAMARDEL